MPPGAIWPLIKVIDLHNIYYTLHQVRQEAGT
jgi:hypothetical protein